MNQLIGSNISGFKTARSHYFLNTYAQIIWGGEIGYIPQQYTFASILRGEPGKISLANGRMLITDKVIEYIK